MILIYNKSKLDISQQNEATINVHLVDSKRYKLRKEKRTFDNKKPHFLFKLINKETSRKL